MGNDRLLGLVGLPAQRGRALLGLQAQGASGRSRKTISKIVDTWNPLAKGPSITLSNGNMSAASSASWNTVRTVNARSSGKFYAEFTPAAAGMDAMFGLCNSSASLTAYLGSDTYAIMGYLLNAGYGGYVFTNNEAQSSLPTIGRFATQSMLGGAYRLAVDTDNRLLWLRAPVQSWNNSAFADPANGVGGFPIPVAGDLYLAVGLPAGGNTITLNCGASAFSGAVPAGFMPWNGL